MSKQQSAPAPARTEPPSQARRVTAASIDALVALVCGLSAGTAAGVTIVDGVVELQPQSSAVWGSALGAAIGLSFVNHVLLTLATRASLGKLLAGLRVVRTSDGGHPGLPRLIGRWLFGFYWMALFVPIHLAADSDIDQQDAVGLRVTRRSR